SSSARMIGRCTSSTSVTVFLSAICTVKVAPPARRLVAEGTQPPLPTCTDTACTPTLVPWVDDECPPQPASVRATAPPATTAARARKPITKVGNTVPKKPAASVRSTLHPAQGTPADHAAEPRACRQGRA